MAQSVRYLINFIVNIIYLSLIVYVVMGYIGKRDNPIYQTIAAIIEPVLERIRAIFPPVNRLDFSPMILYLLIWFLHRLILWIF